MNPVIIGTATLYNMDCMEYMKTLPDKAFDLAIVDPPYGIGIDGQKEQQNNKNPKHNRKHHEKKGWDNKIPDASYFRELERVSKEQIIWGGITLLSIWCEALRAGFIGIKGKTG